MSTADDTTPATPALDPSLVSYTHIIYALHALGVVIGITTSATVIGSFLVGLPSIIAVIMNYARRAAVSGTFLESHFRWQIRTFWFALLWSVLNGIVNFVLAFVLIGFVTFFIGLAVIGLWVIYRVLRGWLALRDARPMYAS
ncbi:MAG: hypothetical protein R3E77_01870 [Steroidobacteraceae bacterium]